MREGPFAEDGSRLEAMWVDAPELEVKTLFEWLSEEHPERYEPPAGDFDQFTDFAMTLVNPPKSDPGAE
jgi:hypothetical protein